MSAAPVLRTKRLILRPFTAADLPAFFEIMSDEQTNTFLPWFPVKTLDQAERMLEERYLSRCARGCHFAVCLGERPIGYINLDGEAPYDLGYGLLPAYWGRGLAAEAARAVLDWARAQGFPYVTATHDRSNPASGRVMKKLGMTYRYSYEELWQPKNFPVVFRLYQINFAEPAFVYPGYAQRYPHFVEPNP
jgi:ribosomal-protein-alanine N-acetyltransferase